MSKRHKHVKYAKYVKTNYMSEIRCPGVMPRCYYLGMSLTRKDEKYRKDEKLPSGRHRSYAKDSLSRRHA
jgi:hypothetical protein